MVSVGRDPVSHSDRALRGYHDSLGPIEVKRLRGCVLRQRRQGAQDEAWLARRLELAGVGGTEGRAGAVAGDRAQTGATEVAVGAARGHVFSQRRTPLSTFDTSWNACHCGPPVPARQPPFGGITRNFRCFQT